MLKTEPKDYKNRTYFTGIEAADSGTTLLSAADLKEMEQDMR